MRQFKSLNLRHAYHQDASRTFRHDYHQLLFLQKINQSAEQNHVVANPSKVPTCLQKMIDSYRAEEKQNPPRQIFSYTYKGKVVYYATPPCCDFFSDLYDSECNLLGHPDGGITGKGDGKLTDFAETRTDEKLIWKDERK